MTVTGRTPEAGAMSADGGGSLEPGARVGRFVVVGKAGRGGMGVVYAAYDPDLDRKIALKLLRVEATDSTSASQGRLRLQREAQAMARLAHPNVVTVYDVGVYGEQVFIAMELVDGQTVTDWLAQKPRSRKEALRVFQQAGEGLAAAHAAGIVHRDFKPSNVLVGTDGRVRVMDFGVARSAKASVEAGAAKEANDRPVSIETPLTRVGAMVGTPGYMAPEQYEGGEVDARTDQYGFCVALYEALYGERPFRGETVWELRANVAEGRIQEAPKNSDVPAWLRSVVLRGLAVDPGKRYADMRALLGALARDPAIARRKWSLAAAALCLVAALGLGARQWMKRQSRMCKGAEAKLVGIWDAERRQAVEAAFKATAKSYAADTWSRVASILDAYSTQWVAMHADACEATHVRGEQSGTLLDLRMGCLESRLKQVKALVGVFAQADAIVVEKAVQAAHNLPQLSRCADREALTAVIAPPEDADTQTRVQLLRDKLIEANALEEAGKYRAGLDLATAAAAQAKELGYVPVEAEALLRLGTLQRELGKYEAAERALREAWRAAETANHGEVEAMVAIELAHVVGDGRGHPEEGEEIGLHAGAIVKRLRGNYELEGKWLNTMSIIFWTKGDLDQTQSYGERALAVLEKALGSEHPLVAACLNNLGNALSEKHDYEKAQAYYERSLAIREKALGPQHPRVAGSLNNLGIVLRAKGDYDRAQAYYERALFIKQKTLGPEHPDVAASLHNVGTVLHDKGKYDEARRYYERSLAIVEKSFGKEHPEVAASFDHLGQVLYLKGKYPEAQRYFERSLAIREKALGPAHPDVGRSLDGLTSLFSSRGQYDKAKACLERALAIRQKALGPEHPLVAATLSNLGVLLRDKGEYGKAQEYSERALSLCQSKSCDPDVVAEAAFNIAEVLSKLGRDGPRARELATRARAELVKLPRLKEKLGQVDAWLAKHRE